MRNTVPKVSVEKLVESLKLSGRFPAFLRKYKIPAFQNAIEMMFYR